MSYEQQVAEAQTCRADDAGLTVCVFSSSSNAASGPLRELARALGAGIAARGWRLVYGGGGLGLMGETARTALAGGAHVTGVIPTGLVALERELLEVSELIHTETMRERKRLMDERADGFVILPGGIGTLEELLEVVTLRQLGFHDRPIALVDPDGFWDPLREQIDRIIVAGLAGPHVARMFEPVGSAEEALGALSAPQPHA